MTKEDLKQKFIEKWSQFGMQEGLKNAIKEELLSDLNALISEHYYPKGFISLLGTHYIAKNEGTFWIAYYEDAHNAKNFKTIDELYNYWKENER